jgi:hypothetical protein
VGHTRHPDLVPTPQTDRIHRACERLGRGPRLPRPLNTALARLDPDLVGPPPSLDRVDADPDTMVRLKAGAEARPLGRPDAVEDQVTQLTPQFFLRHTHRAERAADPDDLERTWRPLRDQDWAEDLQWSRTCASHAGPPPVLASAALAMHVAEHRALVVETRWPSIYGKPDPGD